MNKDQSAQLKVLLIEMFGWFHDFCEANHLRYYALGGTWIFHAKERTAYHAVCFFRIDQIQAHLTGVQNE